MNYENFPRQLSKVKVTVNSNLNSIGLISFPFQKISLLSSFSERCHKGLRMKKNVVACNPLTFFSELLSPPCFVLHVS